MKALSLAAGLSETAVRSMLKLGHKPSIDKIEAIAGVLGMSLAELLEGDAGTYQRVRVLGYASSGEGWLPFDDEHTTAPVEHIELRIEGGDPIAVQVRGDSMAPVYRDGDWLIGARRAGRAVDNLIGLDCILMTAKGERFIKFLTRGMVRGAYNLRSYNPTYKDLENVKISWAAPILLIKRSER